MIQKTHGVLKNPEYNQRSRISPIRTNGDIKNLKDRTPWTVMCLQNIPSKDHLKEALTICLNSHMENIEET